MPRCPFGTIAILAPTPANPMSEKRTFRPGWQKAGSFGAATAPKQIEEPPAPAPAPAKEPPGSPRAPFGAPSWGNNGAARRGSGRPRGQSEASGANSEQRAAARKPWRDLFDTSCRQKVMATPESPRWRADASARVGGSPVAFVQVFARRYASRLVRRRSLLGARVEQAAAGPPG